MNNPGRLLSYSEKEVAGRAWLCVRASQSNDVVWEMPYLGVLFFHHDNGDIGLHHHFRCLCSTGEQVSCQAAWKAFSIIWLAHCSSSAALKAVARLSTLPCSFKKSVECSLNFERTACKKGNANGVVTWSNWARESPWLIPATFCIHPWYREVITRLAQFSRSWQVWEV